MKSKILALIITGVVFVALGSMVQAETSHRAGVDDDAAAKAQYLLRQMASERDALQAQNDKLQEQVDKLQKDVDARKKEAARIKKNLATSGDELSRSEARNKAIMDRLLRRSKASAISLKRPWRKVTGIWKTGPGKWLPAFARTWICTRPIWTW